MEDWGRTAQKIRVPLGTAIGIIFLLLMHPSMRSITLGAMVAFAGAGFRIWASGNIIKGKVLAQSGPYAYTRNPLYFGSFIMALGVLVSGQGFWLIIPFCLFFAAIYYPVMKAEERELIQGHGDNFRAYVRRVPFFFPAFRAKPVNASSFSWDRVLKNREHRTIAGLLLIEAFLICLALTGIRITSLLASLFFGS
jgi:protein-S-isoprenylcysteine O-methyltransferase Ste14